MTIINKKCTAAKSTNMIVQLIDDGALLRRDFVYFPGEIAPD